LEAALKSPLANACACYDVVNVQNIELAHYVDRLQDENDELHKCLDWLLGCEP
jgi:hypothetical protein